MAKRNCICGKINAFIIMILPLRDKFLAVHILINFCIELHRSLWFNSVISFSSLENHTPNALKGPLFICILFNINGN